MNTLNFKEHEFECACCGESVIDPHLKAVLELVRHHFDASVTITSAYRCMEYNCSEEVGSTIFSQHPKGTAADICVKGFTSREVYDFLNKVFPNSYGLGYYTTFVHIDVRAIKARW